MDIGIIGGGHIGATAAKLLVQAGHRVTIGNSRGPASLRGLVAEPGEGASAAEPGAPVYATNLTPDQAVVVLAEG